MSFLIAAIFISLFSPLWLPLSALWCLLIFGYYILSNYLWVFQQVLFYDLPASEFVGMFIFIPFYSVYMGVIAFFDIPVWIWNWARYDQTLIAFLLSVILMVVMYSRRKSFFRT